MNTKKKVPVVFVLHAYQPVTQDEKILKRIINNCYLPFLKLLVKKPEIKINLNITGCLLEKLAIKYPEVLELLEKAIQANQVEIMGSAFYHPILPLLSPQDQRYQIKKQKETVHNILGVNTGVFFPPELAISMDLIPQIIKEGYEILVAPDNISYHPFGGIYELENGRNILVLKRNKKISNKISFDFYNQELEEVIEDMEKTYSLTNYPIVLAMDLETFGEHHENYYKFFFEICEKIETSTLTLSLRKFPNDVFIETFNTTTWSTSDKDLEESNPFPLWSHPLNPIHQLQQSHIQLLERVREFINSGDWFDDYQASHYSCQFWWASRDWWASELILLGLQLQRETLLKMIEVLPNKSKQIIFNLSNDIIQRIVDIIAVIEVQNEDSIHIS
ncbi:MAG: hypothetical protein HGN29_06495 [Asgard group archaeon]|nr:hypothetical protein [Asgard group archaeon]